MIATRKPGVYEVSNGHLFLSTEGKLRILSMNGWEMISYDHHQSLDAGVQFAIVSFVKGKQVTIGKGEQKQKDKPSLPVRELLKARAISDAYDKIRQQGELYYFEPNSDLPQ